MKTNVKLMAPVFSLFILLSLMAFNWIPKPDNSAINGAWKYQQGTVNEVLIFSDGYFMHSTFDKTNKKFIGSRGGAYSYSGNDLNTTIEFNTMDKSEIGNEKKYNFDVSNNQLRTDLNGKTASWTAVDNGKGEMAGTWRSSGRMQDGKVVLSPPRARKTFKILTGSRFQWAAINAETKEFFGTGGGTYTFQDGKYTENIEFFSRDSSRVGASLTFDGKIQDGHWHHSGTSSRGTPIYEIWSKEPMR